MKYEWVRAPWWKWKVFFEIHPLTWFLTADWEVSSASTDATFWWLCFVLTVRRPEIPRENP